MRFTSQQDYNLFTHFNTELMNTVSDIQVVIFKLNVVQSKKNIYNESDKKQYYRGVQIPALPKLDFNVITKVVQTLDVNQEIEFAFLREECKRRNILPEIGDIIAFNAAFFEINTVNDIQLIAGQSIYNHSIVVTTHLTRLSATQLEAMVIAG